MSFLKGLFSSKNSASDEREKKQPVQATSDNSLRRRISEIVNSNHGSRNVLRTLIADCKHDPDGISILRDARSNCNASRTELLADLDDAIKSLHGGSTTPRGRTLVCQNNKCREAYDLNYIVTVSDEQTMDWLKGGGATVIGEMSGHPILVGKSNRPTSESDLKELLKVGPKLGWQCSKCKAENQWNKSYTP